MHLTPTDWALAIVGAFVVGMSKTGLAGLGIFGVVLFAMAMPGFQSAGALLPILISADIIAVASYRRHAVWSHLVRLAPWVVLGVVLGFFTIQFVKNMKHGDAYSEQIIGVIVFLMSLMQIRRYLSSRNDAVPNGDTPPPHGLPFVSATGVFGGFSTMVANAAGPVMILYFLASGLPKMEFVGTGAWFYLCVNLFKVPFSAENGLIDLHSLWVDLLLAPISIAGALVGRMILHKINQKQFESLALVLTLVASIKLMWPH